MSLAANLGNERVHTTSGREGKKEREAWSTSRKKRTILGQPSFPLSSLPEQIGNECFEALRDYLCLLLWWFLLGVCPVFFCGGLEIGHFKINLDSQNDHMRHGNCVIVYVIVLQAFSFAKCKKYT